MSYKCSYCYEAEVLYPRAGFVIACDACLAKNLCYFCRKVPATRSDPNPRTGVRYPMCEACWDEQVRLGVTSQSINFGCLAVIASAIGGIIFAIKSC